MPEEIQVIMREAENFKAQREWDLAIEKYKEVLDLDPTNEEAVTRLAELYAIRGLISDVIEQYFKLMDILEQKEEYDLAVEVARWIMKIQPENDKARMKTILIYKKKGDLEEVVKQSLELARLYIELGQGDQSILLLKNAQEIAPDNLDIGLELAEMYISYGHIQEGTNQYRKIANAYLAKQDYEKAAEAFRRMKIVTPDDPQLSFTLGNLYMKLGKLDEAEAEFRAILRHNLNHTEALMALGNVCQKKGRFRDAILAFNKILSVNPQDEVAKEKLGELYQAQGATNEAVKHYLQAASTYQYNGQVDRAIALYQRVLSIDPTNPTACRELTNLGAPLEPEKGEAVLEDAYEAKISPLKVEEIEVEEAPLEEVAGAVPPEELEIPEESLEELAGEVEEEVTPEAEGVSSAGVPSAFAGKDVNIEEFKRDVGDDLVFTGEEGGSSDLEIAEEEEKKPPRRLLGRGLKRKGLLKPGGGLLRRGLLRKGGEKKKGLKAGLLSRHGKPLKRKVKGLIAKDKPVKGLFRRRSLKPPKPEEPEVEEFMEAVPEPSEMEASPVEGEEVPSEAFAEEEVSFEAAPLEQEEQMYEEVAPVEEEFEPEPPPLEEAPEMPEVEVPPQFEEEQVYEEPTYEEPAPVEYEEEMPPPLEEVPGVEGEFKPEPVVEEEIPHAEVESPEEVEFAPAEPPPLEEAEPKEKKGLLGRKKKALRIKAGFGGGKKALKSKLKGGLTSKKKLLKRKKKEEVEPSWEYEVPSEGYETFEEPKVEEPEVVEPEVAPLEPVEVPEMPEEPSLPEAEEIPMVEEEKPLTEMAEIPPVEEPLEEMPSMEEVSEIPEEAFMSEEMDMEIPELDISEAEMAESLEGFGEEMPEAPSEVPPVEEPISEFPSEEVEIPTIGVGLEEEKQEAFEEEEEMDMTIPDLTAEEEGEKSSEIEDLDFLGDIDSLFGEEEGTGGLSDFTDLLKLAEDIENIVPDEERLREAEEAIQEETKKEEEVTLEGASEEEAGVSVSTAEMPLEDSGVSLSALPEFPEMKTDTGELELAPSTSAVPTSFLPPLEDMGELQPQPQTKILEEIEAPPEIEIQEEEVKAEVVEEVPSAVPELEPDIEEKIKEAMAEGDMAKSFDLYRRALDIKPDNLDIRREFADLCYTYGLIDEAIESYKVLLEKEPKNYEVRKKIIRTYLIYNRTDEAVESLSEYGNVLTSDDRLDEAQRIYQYALALKKEDHKAREALSEIYLNQEMKQLALYHLNILAEYLEEQKAIDETINVLKKIFSLTSDINVQEKLAQVYIENGYNAYAIVELQNLAERYIKQEDYKKAASHYEKIVEIDPKNIEAHNHLIDLYKKLGDKERSYRENVLVADLLLEKGEYDEARLRYESCLKAKKYDHDVRRKLVDIYIHIGDIDKAMEETQILSSVYYKERRYNEAIDLYLKLLEKVPENLSLREKLSEFYVMSEQYQKALEQLMIVAEEQEKKEEWDAAIKTYKKALTIDEKNADIHYRIGTIFLEHKNNITEARYEFDKVVQIDPTHRKALEHLVDLYLKEDKPAKAVGVLKQLIELDESYSSLKDKIIDHYKALIEKDPKDYKAHFNLGIVYKELAMWKQAIEQFQITRKSPEYVLESHNMLGIAFSEQPAMVNLAIKTLEKGLKLKGFKEKDYIDLHYNLGKLYEKVKKFEKAIEEYQAVLAIDPHYKDTAELLKNLKKK